ncbi:NADP-dependent oxidoreductase [Streptomyces sp. NPDC051320]|uniref:NADP-dependent oxidoreductase n=1 Tax=Streptomyces sp. NPDC051320 TaxID=3154644 RepID=UPI00342C25B9
MPAPEQQARAVRFDRYGDRSVLYVADVPTPRPAAGEVLVEVRAAGINPGETAIRTGELHDRFPAIFPSGQGSDLAGIVIAAGEGVTDFVPGEVLGYSWRRSSHATHVAVPVAQLIRKPEALGWAAAGSLYVAACTAWAAVDAVAPQPGETVAVSAAAGGVGSIVVQLLRVRGAHVLGIASTANASWLTAHGATAVPYGDRLAADLTAAAPQGIDAFIDLFGPEYSTSPSIWESRRTGSKRSSPSSRRRGSVPRARAAWTVPAARFSPRWPNSWRATVSRSRSPPPTP